MEITKYLEEQLNKEYNSSEVKRIIEGYRNLRKTTFRVNNIKANIKEIRKVLDEHNIKYSCTSWSNDAFILESDLDIRKLNIYEEGKIYIQSLSSMLPVIVLNPIENESILDMCAAPGSKTTMIASLTNNKVRIMATEKDKIRCDKLKYNINKQGVKSVNEINRDALKLDDYFRFDKILIDAPCSGSGTINKDNIKYFSKELVENSKRIQLKLLKKAINLVKVGGTIIYSTCSILKEENEEVLEEVLKDDRIILEKIDLDVPKLDTNIEGTICVCPNKEYEGFFVSKLKRIK